MRGSPRKQYARHFTGKHVPNKEEAKELRRLMQKSGQTEEEVRSNKVNRVRLAKAQKSPQSGTGSNAYRLRIRQLRNDAALELGTHTNDPRVDKRARVLYLKQLGTRIWGYR